MSVLKRVIDPRLFEMLTPKFYTSTVSIYPKVESQNETGEPTTTYPTPLSADYTAIPCAIAASDANERRTPTHTYAESTHTIALTDYYPLIQTVHRAIDGAGISYDILGVEHDSQHAHTALMCRIVSV